MADETTPEPATDDEGAIQFGSWQFIDTAPTVEDVDKLLRLVPTTFGVNIADFADYVQALPSSVKINGVKHDSWTLYVSVAGRVKMLNAAAEEQGWRVDFIPEPNTPTGVPGYLRADDERIVYREYVAIYKLPKTTAARQDFEVLLGQRPGTAWVPAEGGQGAVWSNRYEKVETSARGRAIAAWGFGVLPGSGIASLEEMQSAMVDQHAPRERSRGRQPDGPRRPRAEILEELLTRSERVRQLRNVEPEVQLTRMAEYAKRAFNVDIATEGYTDGEGDEARSVVVAVDWAKLSDAQLTLTSNQLRDTLVKLEAEGSEV